MEETEDVWRNYRRHFIFLLLLAVLLLARLVYLTLANPNRFPIHTIQVEASYEHVSRGQLESMLTPYLKESFYSLQAHDLKQELQTLPWVAKAQVKRKWPDILSISLVEHKPVALWNGAFLTENSDLLKANQVEREAFTGPNLSGPPDKTREVLQTYEKLSKLLGKYGLSASKLSLSESQSWELTLANGVKLRLGKQDLETRLGRFCRAYPAVFGEKPELLSSVDLRYPRGMAAKWKQPNNKSRR